MFLLKMETWEIECSQCGKENPTITSLLVIQKLTIGMLSRTLILMVISKVFGPMFIILIMLMQRKQLPTLSMEKIKV